MPNGSHDSMIRECQHLPELMQAQAEVMRRYLAAHKDFHDAPDEQEKVLHFIDEYGWLMREFYCGNICQYRDNCEIAQPFVPNGEISDEVLEGVIENGNGSSRLLEAEASLLERHIDRHKYFRGIPDKKAGVLDFLRQYGPIMEELFNVAVKR